MQGRYGCEVRIPLSKTRYEKNISIMRVVDKFGAACVGRDYWGALWPLRCCRFAKKRGAI
jgi:hypothetical protein